jgi:hypothetical protein
MFQLLFRYPGTVFRKGQFVLLGAWPVWVLVVLIFVSAVGLALLIRWRLRDAAPRLRSWRAWALWAMQSALVALLLLLLWQPAMRVSELSSQQNIIAVIVDDSRSMAIADSDGKTREAAATAALQDGVLAGLQKRFQTRIYRLGGGLTPVADWKSISPVEASTHIGDSLKQLTAETSDLPVGAVVLLSDGGENTLGMGGSTVGMDALQALRNRRLPVHTIGFGREEQAKDVEMEDVSVAASAVANARLTATISFTQHGFAGQRAMLTVRDAEKMLASREISLAANGVIQTEPLLLSAGAAGAKSLQFSIEPQPGEENRANNTLTRPMLVSDAKRRILYIEGEPRWEYKFIRRAEDDDPTVQLASMLRTSENKVYRQGISDPGELADGFPVRAEDLFGYAGIIIGSVDADYFTPLQQELLREYVDRRGGGILFLGGRSSLSDGGWGASSLNELLPTFLPPGRNSFHLSDYAAAGRPNEERRALEEADLPRRLRRPRIAEAWRDRAGADERRPSQAAAVDHRELRPRPHGDHGYRRYMALADERGTRRPVARSLLAAAAALADCGVAGAGDGFDAGAHAARRRPGADLGAGARPPVSARGECSCYRAHRWPWGHQRDAGDAALAGYARVVSGGVDGRETGTLSRRGHGREYG